MAAAWRLNGKGVGRDDRAETYELRTSCADCDLEDIVLTYWRLAGIEATFRALKSEMGLGPVWYRKRERIRAHLFATVLAGPLTCWVSAVRRPTRECRDL